MLRRSSLALAVLAIIGDRATYGLAPEMPTYRHGFCFGFGGYSLFTEYQFGICQSEEVARAWKRDLYIKPVQQRRTALAKRHAVRKVHRAKGKRPLFS